MTLLVYGAYGYTGERIAREAAARDIDLVVAGRNGTKTRGLGIELDVGRRVFNPEEAADELDDVDVLLNCAGPFVHTADPLVEACLDTGTHYLDITGELAVLEALAERDREAEGAGIAILPGVGFDVVPTDCLAAHLHDRMPGATHLRLGFDAPTSPSSGTLKTALEHTGDAGKVRRDGALVDVPVAADSRTIDFGAGPRNAMTVPWGDVATAYYTTGVPNIEMYMAVPGLVERLLRLGAPARRLLAITPLRRVLQGIVDRVVSGPADADTRLAFVWGEATDGDRTVTSRLLTPEPYRLTVDAATTATQRVADADSTGFQTPAAAFDTDFVLGLDGVEGFFDEGFPSLVDNPRFDPR